MAQSSSEPRAAAAPETAPAVARSAAAAEEASSRPFAWHGALFLMLTVFVAADLASDFMSGTTPLHVSLEIVALCVALAGVVGAARQLRSAFGQAHSLEQRLAGARADADRWRSEAQGLLLGLGTAIDRQFARWGLTAAEAEVALLVLKGLSYKEVAAARGTAERTIRHQALAIYRKAGLSGRAEMAAFFLEDLLLPVRDAARAAAPEPAARAPSAEPLPRFG